MNYLKKEINYLFVYCYCDSLTYKISLSAETLDEAVEKFYQKVGKVKLKQITEQIIYDL